MRLPSALPAFVLATGLLALVNCSCPDNEPPPPRFMLAFSSDTLTSAGVGFRRAEIRSAYIVRYADAHYQALLDTLRQPTATSIKSDKALFAIAYGPDFPSQFTLPDYVSQNVNAHSFRLVVPAANRTYDINNVVLEQTAGSGRCASPRTSRNEATVNGQVLRVSNNALPLLTK